MAPAPDPDPVADGADTRRVRLTLVRHGESTYNVDGRWQGHGDAPLSERGREQARRVGERLRSSGPLGSDGAGGDLVFDRVISSDLQRAHDTARAIAGDLRVVEAREVFREIDVGNWEGLTRAEVAERYPEDVKVAFRGHDVKIGGGESWADLSARVGGGLRALLGELAAGEHALLVAHGGVIASLLSGLLGFAEMRPRPLGRISNTAISEVEFELRGGGGAIAHTRLCRFNDASHALPRPAWVDEMLEAGHAATDLIARPGAPSLSAAELHARVTAKEPPAQLEVPGATLASLVGERMGHSAEGAASVASPAEGSITRVIATRKGLTFADFGAARKEA